MRRHESGKRCFLAGRDCCISILRAQPRISLISTCGGDGGSGGGDTKELHNLMVAGKRHVHSLVRAGTTGRARGAALCGRRRRGQPESCHPVMGGRGRLWNGGVDTCRPPEREDATGGRRSAYTSTLRRSVGSHGATVVAVRGLARCGGGPWARTVRWQSVGSHGAVVVHGPPPHRVNPRTTTARCGGSPRARTMRWWFMGPNGAVVVRGPARCGGRPWARRVRWWSMSPHGATAAVVVHGPARCDDGGGGPSKRRVTNATRGSHK